MHLNRTISAARDVLLCRWHTYCAIRALLDMTWRETIGSQWMNPAVLHSASMVSDETAYTGFLSKQRIDQSVALWVNAIGRWNDRKAHRRVMFSYFSFRLLRALWWREIHSNVSNAQLSKGKNPSYVCRTNILDCEYRTQGVACFSSTYGIILTEVVCADAWEYLQMQVDILSSANGCDEALLYEWCFPKLTWRNRERLAMGLFRFFSPTFGEQIIMVVDRIDQRAYYWCTYADIQEYAFVMQRFPFAIPDSLKSRNYVQLRRSLSSHTCLYMAYGRYSDNRLQLHKCDARSLIRSTTVKPIMRHQCDSDCETTVAHLLEMQWLCDVDTETASFPCRAFRRKTDVADHAGEIWQKRLVPLWSKQKMTF